jgi:hypothetical protein
LKYHPRSVQSIETLDMIWDYLLQSANEFYRTLLRNPLDDSLVDKATSVRYLRKLFFNNVVFREIYYGCSYLPNLAKYAL